MRAVIAIVSAALAITPAVAQHRYLGETYVCHFPKAGRVVIDTREPGSSITWKGKRYAVNGGSYLYTTEDGAVQVMFGPRMRWWEFGDQGDRDNHCSARKNLR